MSHSAGIDPVKPLDARLAARLVRPLQHSRVTPNHLTTLRICFGLGACALLAGGGYAAANLGALCMVVSNFLDHADGELARMTGNTSRAGHYYDLAGDAAVHVLLFVGMGAGLADSLGGYALPLGLLAGAAVALIFYLRLLLEEARGKAAVRQPGGGRLESEDVLYLLPLVTLLDQLQPFLVLAAVGAPLFALATLGAWLAGRRR